MVADDPSRGQSHCRPGAGARLPWPLPDRVGL